MIHNKLIAEFMELPIEIFNSGLLNYYHREYNSGTWYEERELSYDISWDWLMPVVEKILNESNNNEINVTPNIEVTYKEVVEFIKIYNNKKI